MCGRYTLSHSAAEVARHFGLDASAEHEASSWLELPRYNVAPSQRVPVVRRELGDDHEDTLASMTNMATLLKAQGDLGGAEGYSRAAVDGWRRLRGDDDEKTLTAINNYGILLQSMGRLDEAVPHIEEAIRLNPRFSDAHRHMGLVFAERGELDLAEQKFRYALQLNPRGAVAYFFLGKVHAARGEIDEARESYETALRIKPDYTLANIALQELNLMHGLGRIGGSGGAPPSSP